MIKYHTIEKREEMLYPGGSDSDQSIPFATESLRDIMFDAIKESYKNNEDFELVDDREFKIHNKDGYTKYTHGEIIVLELTDDISLNRLCAIPIEELKYYKHGTIKGTNIYK